MTRVEARPDPSATGAPRPVVTAIRLGRLGDVVMTLPALEALQAETALQVITDARSRGLLAHALPAARVVSPTDLGSLAPAAARLDLHGVRRASRLLAQAPTQSAAFDVRVDKESLRRRALLLPGLSAWGPRRSWPQRHVAAAGVVLAGLGLAPAPPACRPRLLAPGPPASRNALTLGLVPGAAWASKRWPAAHFGALARRWAEELGGAVLVFASRDEDTLADHVVAAAGGAANRWPEDSDADPILGLLAGLARCTVVVAGDTGALHVAGALGVPVVGLFGPTPQGAGFWVWEGVALSNGALCRPCSLHGGPRCPLGHQRCLTDLDVASVFAAARRCQRSAT